MFLPAHSTARQRVIAPTAAFDAQYARLRLTPSLSKKRTDIDDQAATGRHQVRIDVLAADEYRGRIGGEYGVVVALRKGIARPLKVDPGVIDESDNRGSQFGDRCKRIA